MRRRRVLLASVLLVPGLWLGGNAASSATAEATCEVPQALIDDFGSPQEETHATKDKHRERTQFFANKAIYRVTHCTLDGDLIVSQVNESIDVPGGRKVYAPVSTTTVLLDGTIKTETFMYGNPEDPVWAAIYEENKHELKRLVLPPTGQTTTTAP